MPHPTRDEVKEDIRKAQEAAERRAQAEAGIPPQVAEEPAESKDPIALEPAEPAEVHPSAGEPTGHPSHEEHIDLTAPPDKVNDPDYWRNRAQTLKGMMEAEKNRLAEQLEETRQQVEMQNKLLVNITSQQLNQPVAGETTPSPQNTDAEVTEKDVDEAYPQSVIDDLGYEFLKTELQKDQRNQRSFAKLQQDSFWNQVESFAPRARQINTSDKNWPKWLDQPADQYSGRTRRQIADEAIRSNNPETVGRLFAAYQAESNGGKAPGEPASEPEKTPSNPQPKVAAQAMPKAASGGQQRTSDGKPIYRTSQINAFYAAVQNGRYNGRERERRQIQRQIAAANDEGRIING